MQGCRNGSLQFRQSHERMHGQKPCLIALLLHGGVQAWQQELQDHRLEGAVGAAMDIHKDIDAAVIGQVGHSCAGCPSWGQRCLQQSPAGVCINQQQCQPPTPNSVSMGSMFRVLQCCINPDWPSWSGKAASACGGCCLLLGFHCTAFCTVEEQSIAPLGYRAK